MTAIGPLSAPPRAPSTLPKEGQDEWRKAAVYLVDRGLLHSADLPMLETYCNAILRRRRIEDALAKVELLEAAQLSPDGLAVLNKTAKELLTQVNLAAGVVARCSSALCLNPSSRIKLHADARKAPGSSEEEAAWKRALTVRI